MRSFQFGLSSLLTLTFLVLYNADRSSAECTNDEAQKCYNGIKYAGTGNTNNTFISIIVNIIPDEGCASVAEAKGCLTNKGCYVGDAYGIYTFQADMFDYVCKDGRTALDSAKGCLLTKDLGDKLMVCDEAYNAKQGPDNPVMPGELCRVTETQMSCYYNATKSSCNKDAATALTTAMYIYYKPSFYTCNFRNPALTDGALPELPADCPMETVTGCLKDLLQHFTGTNPNGADSVSNVLSPSETTCNNAKNAEECLTKASCTEGPYVKAYLPLVDAVAYVCSLDKNAVTEAQNCMKKDAAMSANEKCYSILSKAMENPTGAGVCDAYDAALKCNYNAAKDNCGENVAKIVGETSYRSIQAQAASGLARCDIKSPVPESGNGSSGIMTSGTSLKIYAIVFSAILANIKVFIN